MKKRPPAGHLSSRWLQALFCLLMIFLAGQSLWAVTYYVDSVAGNDGNNGISPETAWKSIRQVNRSWWMFAKGDDLFLKRGCTFIDETLNIKQGGVSSNPTVIGAYGQGNKPVIDGRINSLRGGVLCITAGLAYIVIQDLAIRNTVRESGIGIAADNISNITISRLDIDHIDYNGIVMIKVNGYTIEGCHISYCGNSGIAIIGTLTYPITNGIIRNNVVHDIATNDGITLHSNMEGIDIGPNHLVMDNVCYRCPEQGLDITSGSQITLLRNETYDNGDSGILVGGVSDVMIDRHYSHDDLLMGIIVGAAQNLIIENSVIYNAHYHQLTIGNCSNVRVYNNTIVHGPSSTGSIIDIEGRASIVIFKNNVVASTQFSQPGRYVRYLGGITPASTKSEFSNNIWWRPDGAASDDRLWYDAVRGLYNFYSWQSYYGQDRGGYFTDPRHALPGQRDFHLQSGSLAIDGGAGLGVNYDFEGTRRPQGPLPDIGAYEFKAVSLSASAGATPVSGTCPLAVQFSGNASGGASPYSYSWNFGDGQSSSSQNPSHTYASAGGYAATLTVRDNAGSQASSSISIVATSETSAPLSSSVLASSTSGKLPLTVAFTGVVSGGTPPYAFNWNFGDGQTSAVQNPSYTYASAGFYGAIFTVSDSKGATSTASVNIRAGNARKPSFRLGKTRLRYVVSKSSPSLTNRSFALFKQGVGPMPWTASCDAAWLNCSPCAGTEGNLLNVSVDPSSLAAGIYRATLTVFAPTARKTRQTVSAVLLLTD